MTKTGEFRVVRRRNIMGRKAKLKKLRRKLTVATSTKQSLSSTQFVDQLSKLGYQLEQIERSPEVPVEKIKPQL